MDPEDASSFSDALIQRCELLNSMEQITNLQYRMVLEFAERVERIRWGKQPTQLTRAVRNYIQHHPSEPISTEKMVKDAPISQNNSRRRPERT